MVNRYLPTTVNDIAILPHPSIIMATKREKQLTIPPPDLSDSAYETGTESEISSICTDASRPTSPAKNEQHHHQDGSSDNNDNNDNDDDDDLPQLATAKGHYWLTTTGSKILDACGGAGVACIGHGRKEVIKAITKQMASCSYASYAHFRIDPVERLSEWLVESTGGEMDKVFLMCSGSEAIEASLKLSLEYHSWISPPYSGKPQRTNFITRSPSYHGTTLGSLSASNHHSRRLPFVSSGILLDSHFHSVSACNPYRDQLPNESTHKYVERKLAELESMFLRLGPETVAAVIMEPIIGASMGCLSPPAGYMKGVKQICEKHGALLVFDEVMCGMGRSGSLHAWQSIERSSSTSVTERGEEIVVEEETEEVIPHLQTIGKGFTGGYTPGSALLVGSKISSLMKRDKRVFTHGHTYQNNPLVAAAALAVQRDVIEKEGLLENVRKQEKVLEQLLRQRLGGHPNVGDIRGRGLFWGVEFVKDKKTKEPFDVGLNVAQMVHRTAMKEFGVLVYNGQGCAGEGKGDHVMVMPAYDISVEGLEMIVDGLGKAIESVFERLGGI